MTALLVVLLVVGVGIAAWLYIDKITDFDDEEKTKETLPIENYEVEKPIVEKPKSKKRPSRRKSQNKPKSE
jgi:nitric oxide reductase large subunit